MAVSFITPIPAGIVPSNVMVSVPDPVTYEAVSVVFPIASVICGFPAAIIIWSKVNDTVTVPSAISTSVDTSCGASISVGVTFPAFR